MANIRKPTALTDLPLELLLMISDHLPVVDIACLALCNHHLMDSLREMKAAFDRFSNSRIIEPKDNTRIEFVTWLARDLPSYYCCFACLRLHPWRNIALPHPYFNLPECFESLVVGYMYRTSSMDLKQHPFYMTCQLHFVHVQLAMRRFYYGPQFGIPVESFFSTEVAVYPLENGILKGPRPVSAEPLSDEELDNNIQTTLTSIEARMCPNPPSLCLRTQELSLVRRQNVSEIAPIPDASENFMRICQHISTVRSNIWEIIMAPAQLR